MKDGLQPDDVQIPVSVEIRCPMGFVVRQVKAIKSCDCGQNSCYPAICGRLQMAKKQLENEGLT